MAGHEDRFRQMYADEAVSRLRRLSEDLLALESSGSTPERIASVFREAHTLKGGASVVGLPGVTQVAHEMESILDEVRSGARAVTPALVDVLLNGVDGLRTLIASALERDDQPALVAELVARLRAAAVPSAAAAGLPEPGSAAAALTPGVAAERSASVETIRVPVERLDELVRLVTESAAANLRVGRLLTEQVGKDAMTIHEFRDVIRALNALQETAMRARMVPVGTITDRLQRAVRDVARSAGKEVRWDARGTETELDRSVLEFLSDPLLHLVRNAVDHGIEPPDAREAAGKPRAATVRLHAMQIGSEVVVTLTDDGRGIDLDAVAEKVRSQGVDTRDLRDGEILDHIFDPGLSTATTVSDVSGRGVGLDVVRTSLDRIRGRVEVSSGAGVGTEFRLVVPITLAVLPCLLVEVAGQRYALPLHSVVSAVPARSGAEEFSVAGRPTLRLEHRTVAVSPLAAALGLGADCEGPAVVLSGRTQLQAFRVDALHGQRDVVVTGLSRLLPRIDVVAGASVEPDGSILLVLDPAGLVERACHGGQTTAPSAAAAPGPGDGAGAAQDVKAHILVVDDALTVRELQRSILERAGYAVRTARDGSEALALLAERRSDLVLTDIEMPVLDGFGLTEAIRELPLLAGIPVVILTSRASEANRRRGLEAGADAYVVKSEFDALSLLSTVERLLGERR